MPGPSLDSFEPLFAAAEAEFEDPDQAYKREQRQARLEARSAARAENVSLSALSGRGGARKAAASAAQGSSMMEAMRENKNLSEFVGLVERANLADYIDAQGRMGDAVVYAPTNQALAKIDRDTMKQLKASSNLDDLKIIMRGHIAPAMHDAEGYELDDANVSAAAGFDFADEFSERKSAQPGHSLALRYQKDSEDDTAYVVRGSNASGKLMARAPVQKSITFHDIPGSIQLLDDHLMPE